MTEKPAVAAELAAYLARKCGRSVRKHRHHLAVGDQVVTWTIGHLLEPAPPEAYVERERRPGFADIPLPIIPRLFKYQPIRDEARLMQLKEIARLLEQADEIYNATDNDREGQLIFDELIAYLEVKKPVKRLLFSALDTASLDRAFANIVDNAALSLRRRSLAAKARGQADWLVGINATRALTLAQGKRGGVIPVGRVMTPTLAIVVAREQAIQSFRPQTFYTPTITLPDGTVLVWRGRRSGRVEGMDAEGRIVDRRVAEAIVNAINAGLEGVVVQAQEEDRAQPPPLPFSLPALQGALSRQYGLSVAEITQACQRLYEKKMQTYPGTDCRFLPESMHGEAGNVLAGLQSLFGPALRGVRLARKSGCFNDGKVGVAAHHAIIPTGETGYFGSEAERLVYEAVCRRYIAQFYPDYRYKEIDLCVTFGADVFSAHERVPVDMGWKVVDTPDPEETDRQGMAPDDRLRWPSDTASTPKRHVPKD